MSHFEKGIEIKEPEEKLTEAMKGCGLAFQDASDSIRAFGQALVEVNARDGYFKNGKWVSHDDVIDALRYSLNRVGYDTMTDCDHNWECLPQTFRFGCYLSPDGVASTFTDYKCSKCGEITIKSGHHQFPGHRSG